MTQQEWEQRFIALAKDLTKAMKELHAYRADPNRNKAYDATYSFEVTSTLAHLEQLADKEPQEEQAA